MLTPKQLTLIEYMVTNPQKTNGECIKACGIPERTFYTWKKTIPEFNQELDRRIKEVWKDAERLAVDTMIDLTKEGSFQAAKYILDSLDYAPKQKVAVEADVTNTISITIEDD